MIFDLLMATRRIGQSIRLFFSCQMTKPEFAPGFSCVMSVMPTSLWRPPVPCLLRMLRLAG